MIKEIFFKKVKQKNNSLTGDFLVFDDLDYKTIVYLPPDYYSSKKKFPVLYMHDGQNLFDTYTSFVGVEWEMDETAQRLILQKKIPSLIIVGIYNRGEKRMDDYTPVYDKTQKCGGNAEKYSNFIINILKPYIDKKLRTLVNKENTFIGGSSLGGLVSLWIGYENPNVFSKILAVSPSVWWNEKFIINFIKEKKDIKVWLDMGTLEGRTKEHNKKILKNVKELYKKLKKLEYDVEYTEYIDADHSERAWSQRAEDLLLFLFS
ncbi:MAG: alpha/beta hydrolase-fold protein [Candidatus Muirbacterium halophilum]|nr:alpha/beta hydrolase-fold protein [Candidatus Muirbacterium halophilum]MCK9477630.1 alpha/beta hydrolase-fold protein [Candidatus Muirbacterium halophilum]